MSCCSNKNTKKVKPVNFNPISILKTPKEKPLKKQSSRVKRTSIYPESQVSDNPRQRRKENIKKLEESINQRENFTEKFLAEKIKCGGCNEVFALGDRKLNLNCSSCNNFFHCKIAGRCIGENCKIELDGEICRLGYCLHCVNLSLEINTEDTDDCLCKLCELLPVSHK